MSDIITLDRVVKVIGGGRRAVNGVSFCIHTKEHVAVEGGPGSGKTTLLRLIAGMERPSDGTIFVTEQAVYKMDADMAADFRSRTFGILPRKPVSLEYLTVSENVELPLAIARVPAANRKKAIGAQLEMLGLAYAASAHPSQLSALETCKLAIARAMVTQPPILLIDDLAAGLSEKDAKWVRDYFSALLQSGDYTVLELTGTKNALSQPERVLHLAHGKLEETR